MTYRAVTFDFWNTLVPETSESLDRRRVLWTEVLVDEGHEPTGEQIDDAFKKAWEFFEGKWRANETTDVREVAARGVEALPFAVPDFVADALADAYLQASEETPRLLAPGAAKALSQLRDMGIGTAIICDVGTVPSTRLRRWLHELEVLPLIDTFSFSDEVGVYKPHRRMFEHALAGLGVTDAATAAHVGDIKRTDVAGARAAGMTSVRYTGIRRDEEDGEEADHVIDRFSALFDVLGLA
mgnify:CR=1 FL=1